MRAPVIFMILAISFNATALNSEQNNAKLWVKKTLPNQLEAANKNISTAPGKIQTRNYFNRTDRHKHRKSLAHRTHSKTELDKYISSAKHTREIRPTQNNDFEEEENNNEWNAFATAAVISLTFLALVTIIFEISNQRL